ncbi:MAG: hypothetical protein H7X93_03575 [Sphingomonadaceae bacterium]|nr:hypothetical protein [Sphingomonadaceae bacterium]
MATNEAEIYQQQLIAEGLPRSVRLHKLDAEARRAALEQPSAALVAAGLKPPDGLNVSVSARDEDGRFSRWEFCTTNRAGITVCVTIEDMGLS